MGQYERMPERQVREAGLLAGPRGRELCARLAGIDDVALDVLHAELAPPRSWAGFAAAPAAVGQEPAVGEEEPADDSGELVAVGVDPGDELFGVRELAEVAE